ncbi:hypothetical protein [Sporosarcina sp. A2]|uniref:hypothetical protein n=1 Tax=Sporosarcina sp. A2 TaxID=3393449 RepID=UPI003D7B2FDD
MKKNDSLCNNGFQNNDSSTNTGAQIALWGSAISTFGDALQTLGGAISIEESRISDIQQQQELEKLQSQIDDLKKEQEKNSQSTDAETLNKLLERIVKRLEKDDDEKEK